MHTECGKLAQQLRTRKEQFWLQYTMRQSRVFTRQDLAISQPRKLRLTPQGSTLAFHDINIILTSMLFVFIAGTRFHTSFASKLKIGTSRIFNVTKMHGNLRQLTAKWNTPNFSTHTCSLVFDCLF